MHACTIIARNYLAHARVLAESFLAHHPAGRFTTLILDDPNRESLTPDEAFETLSVYEIGLDRAEVHRMAMIYNVMEFATAVKPWLLRTLLNSSNEDVTYFDPDIQVFDALDDISALAREHSIVLVPHTTSPIPRDGRVPSETTILHSGIFNLGFIAVGTGAHSFLDWWSERLARDCLLEPEQGRFVDQRWVDFVPALFEHHYVLRDPGCDVAHWNLWYRHVEWTGERYEVNGGPLRFYHFSGFDPERPEVLSKHQGGSPRIRISDRPALERLYADYARLLFLHGYREVARLPYGFDRLPDGTPVPDEWRRRYRDELVRSEQNGTPPPLDPFDAEEHEAFSRWVSERAIGRAVPPPRSTSEDRPPPQLQPGINVAGYFAAELGIGEAARRILAGVKRTTIPYSTVAYRLGTQSRLGHPFDPDSSAGAAYDTNIICVNADGLLPFVRHVGRDFFDNRYSIAVWWWEAPEFPRSMRSAFELVDEVWAGSEYTREVITNATEKPVLKVPIPIEEPVLWDRTRADSRLSEDFLFVFAFDFFSVAERKNPFGLVEAFRRAFQPRAGAKLIIKSINGDKVPKERDRLRAATAQHPDIEIVDRYMSAAERDALIGSCDCYVSLHRSEGFGLTMAEAMALGKPVIATAFSGNLEFMDEHNSYLVPYRMTTIPPGCDPYPAGAEWADPDIDVAAELMRKVFDDPSEARERGARARADILERQSAERTAEFIEQRIEAIREMDGGSRRERQGVLDSIFAASPPSPVTLAGEHLAKGAASGLLTQAGSPGTGFVRRLLRRALWPYIADQHELNVDLLQALQQLEASQHRLRELLTGVEHQVDVLSRAVDALQQDHSASDTRPPTTR